MTDKKNQEKTKKEEPTFELLMEKFQFHNTSVHYHANIAQRIAKEIRENHEDEAKKANYFTDDFFNKADEKEGNSFPTDEPQTTEKASETTH